MTGDNYDRLVQNLAEVRGRIGEAAARSGRAPNAVRLVAVSKYVPVEVAAGLIEAGCLDLGEARPQELWSKAEHFSESGVRWHLIGHLQRNKLRRTLPLVYLFQSIDSERLLKALDEEAGLAGVTAECLLEVNVSSDANKTGLPAAELPTLLNIAAELKHVSIRGLMGMASLEGGVDAARRDIIKLRELRDQCANRAAANLVLAELSMGMSDDYEIAIEEGATIVRVGSALFQGLDS